VNAYERVDTTVSAALVNHAGEYSFGRSASRGRIEKYAALVRRQEAELLGEVKNWKWFGREDVMMSQARSGTRHALRLLGKTQNISY